MYAADGEPGPVIDAPEAGFSKIVTLTPALFQAQWVLAAEHMGVTPGQMDGVLKTHGEFPSFAFKIMTFAFF